MSGSALKSVFCCIALAASAVISSASAESFSPLRAITPEDKPGKLQGSRVFETNLSRLHTIAPSKADLGFVPWTSGNWPLHNGLIAARYADGRYPSSPRASEAKWRYEYVRRNPLEQVLKMKPGRDRDQFIDLLSPAEKYDLLVGDYWGALSQKIWADVMRYGDQGRLREWFGICDGASAASSTLQEPTEAVTVKNRDGISITFHALDIKGLLEMVWSAYAQNFAIVGKRCETDSPARGAEGTILDPACFDTNPGSFHIALLNQIGLAKRPLLVDTSHDSEVWNSPVTGYQLKYFNPVTQAEFSDPATATIPVEKFTNDPLRALRSKGTRKIVGVKLRMFYADSDNPRRDGSTSSVIVTEDLVYQLELDDSAEILGGEWIQGSHPDFLWAVPEGTRGETFGDRIIEGETWDGRAPIPASWDRPIRMSSERLQPLSKIVHRLAEMSAKKPLFR